MVQASMDLNHFRFVLGASWDRSAAVGAGVLLSLHVYSPCPGLCVYDDRPGARRLGRAAQGLAAQGLTYDDYL